MTGMGLLKIVVDGRTAGEREWAMKTLACLSKAEVIDHVVECVRYELRPLSIRYSSREDRRAKVKEMLTRMERKDLLWF
jgi:hypothetical protein